MYDWLLSFAFFDWFVYFVIARAWLPFCSSNSSFAHEYAISACQFYPHDHGAFTSSGKDGMVKVWDTRKMTPVHKFTFQLPVLDHHMSLLKSAKPLIAGRNSLKNHSLSRSRDVILSAFWKQDRNRIMTGQDRTRQDRKPGHDRTWQDINSKTKFSQSANSFSRLMHSDIGFTLKSNL